MSSRGWRVLFPLLLAPALLFAWIHWVWVSHANGGDALPNSPPSVVSQAIAAVSADTLVNHVCWLQDSDALGYCNAQGTRYSFSPVGLAEAADYIAARLSSHPVLVVSQPPFTLTNVPPDQVTPGVLTNVVGTLVGAAPVKDRGIVIVSAHYDSISDAASSGGPAPGADDNASGVAAVLEAAARVSQHPMWHTVRFVAFAGEEQGLHGSRYYVDTAREAGENIIGVINADMIGYEGDGEPRLELHARVHSQDLEIAHTFTRTIQDYGLNLFTQVITVNPIRLSDHASFWDRGYPAVLVIEDTSLRGPTQDFNPYYHTTDDTLDKMNRTYFRDIARAIVGTVIRLARPVAPDLRIVQQGPGVVRPGERVTLTLSYANAGTAVATDVVITNTLLYGLLYQADNSGLPRSFDEAGQVIWRLGALDVGAGGTFVVTATMPAGVPATVVRSRVVIAGAGLDTDSIDNVAIAEVDVRTGWRVYLPFLKQIEAGG